MLKRIALIILLFSVTAYSEMPSPTPTSVPNSIVVAAPAGNCSTVIGFGFCQVLYDQCLNICNSSCMNQPSLYPGHLEGELRDCRNKCRDQREYCIDNRIFGR